MFVDMYDGVRNSRLLGSIRRNQLSLLVPRLFRRHFPIIDDLPALHEYAGILRHLRQGEVPQARDVLQRVARNRDDVGAERLAHRLDRHVVGVLAVALPHRARRGDGRRLAHAQEV